MYYKINPFAISRANKCPKMTNLTVSKPKPAIPNTHKCVEFDLKFINIYLLSSRNKNMNGL